MRLSMTDFNGIMPKQTYLNRPATYAEIAENVNLERGSIQAWNQPRKISDAVGDTIYYDACCVLTGPCDASFARTGVECDDIIVSTGLWDEPAFTTDCPANWEPLGFPCDMSAPQVSAPASTEDFSMETRTYVYTVVNRMGWESAPSFPSELVTTNTGASVTVSGFDVPSNAESIRLYRAQTVLDFGTDEEHKQPLQSEFLFVGEFDTETASFTDFAHIGGEVLLSKHYDPPPNNLREICSWREGRLAALSGDKFMMTERSLPHAWNRRYTVAFYDEPIALKCTQRAAYVLTDGRPVLLELRGDCKDGEQPIVVKEIPQSLPIVSRRSAATYGGQCVYASRHGLVVLGGTDAIIVTRDHYTEEQWAQLLPHTMVGEIHDGVYYGVTENNMIRFDLPDKLFAEAKHEALTTLTLRPQGLYAAENGRLYMAMHDGVYEWNTGERRMTYKWRGKIQRAPGITRMTAYRLRVSQNVGVKHLVDTGAIQDIETGNEPTRLPMGYHGEDWEVEFTGKGEIKEYILATSVRDLVGGGYQQNDA